MKRFFSVFIIWALSCTSVSAADATGTMTSGFLLEGLVGLLIVLGLMAGTFWFIKRFQSSRMMPGIKMKVVGGMVIGSRERIMVVEIAEQWLVIGVTPMQINILTTMPRQDDPNQWMSEGNAKSFSEYLKRTVTRNHDA